MPERKDRVLERKDRVPSRKRYASRSESDTCSYVLGHKRGKQLNLKALLLVALRLAHPLLRSGT